MSTFKVKIIHQEAILLRSTLAIDNIIINNSNKFIYFKIDSKDPNANIDPNSLLNSTQYYSIELETKTYTIDPITKKNNELASEINLKIRSADPYYNSFSNLYPFAYIDDNLKLVITSLTLGPYASVELFNINNNSIFESIDFRETKIKGVVKKNFSNYIKDEIIKLSVIAETTSGEVNVTNLSNILSLDQDFFYLIPNSYDPSIKTVDVLAKREGSGIIKVIYKENNETFASSQQFICHDSFFKDNYLNYLMPRIDKEYIESNQFIKSIFDTLMEMIDILYAYNEDLKVIPNFKLGKHKFLSLLSQNVGFERVDFLSFNNDYEFISNETFKELISNMFDLMSIRGTKLAYELFFGALGYNISIQEFWYDSDGNLIEINSDDESKSTFYAYDKFGATLDNPPRPRPDPRNNNNILKNDYNNLNNYLRVLENDSIIYKKISGVEIPQKTQNYDFNVFQNSKSNYIRLVFNNPYNEEYFEDANDFSAEKKLIIKRYLEFLRPNHIQYILESFGFSINQNNLTQDIINSFEENFGISDLLEIKDTLVDEILFFLSDDKNNFNVGDIKNIIEELSSSRKWDTVLRYDENNTYDYKSLLIESVVAKRIGEESEIILT